MLESPCNRIFKPKFGHHIAQYSYNDGNSQAVDSKFNLVLTDYIHVNVVYTILSMKEKPWGADSGSSSHIRANKNMFTSYKTIGEGKERITLSDSRMVDVLGKGKVNLKLTSGKILSLSNVLHVPHMSYNLVSVFILNKASVTVCFESN